MEDIDIYIRSELSERIISELKNEINSLPLTSDDKNELINLLKQAFQIIEWKFDDEFHNRLNRLKNRIPKNYSILIIEAIYLLYHEKHEQVKQIMDNLIDVTNGQLKNNLRQFYTYIRLAHFPKKLEDDIVIDFYELIKYYVPVTIQYTSFLWDINNTLPEGYPFEKYDALCKAAIKRNPREKELFGYYFYILNHYERWEQIIELADFYLQQFPYSTEINTTCYLKANALFHIEQHHKAIRWFHNCILNTTGIDAENDILKAMAETGTGICFIEIARQRNDNFETSYNLKEYYRKANKLFKSALTKIDCDEDLDKYHLLSNLVLNAMENCN